MPRDTLLFDINETTLNLNQLKSLFKNAFGEELYMSVWFFMLLHTSTVCAMTNVKTDFASLAKAMLDALEAKLGCKLTLAQKSEIIDAFASLPPHDDMLPALKQFKHAGYRVIAFTNSSLNFVKRQITNSGLVEYFDDFVSVEQIASFKPDLKTYHYVAQQVQRPIQDVRLIATHDWDTHAALTAGMQAAYIERTHIPYNPYYLRPEIFENDMRNIANRIIQIDQA